MSDFLNAFEAFLAKPGADRPAGRAATGGVVVKAGQHSFFSSFSLKPF